MANVTRKATGWQARGPDLDPGAPVRTGEVDVAGQGDEEKLDGETLERVRAVGGALRGWRVRDTLLADCDLSGVVVERSELTRVTVRGGRLSGCAWLNGSAGDVRLEDVRADDLTLRFSRLRTVSFVDCRLPGLDLSGAQLDHVEFVRCRLSGARFHEAETLAARFVGCDLSGVTGVGALRGASVDQEGLLSLAPALADELGIAITA